jgi:hypothetical protein
MPNSLKGAKKYLLKIVYSSCRIENFMDNFMIMKVNK